MPRPLTVLLLVALAAPASADNIVRGPYVQEVTPRSLVIAVRLARAAPLSLSFGPSEALGSTLRSPAARDHAFRLEGLTPGMTLRYRVEGEAAIHAVQTSPEGLAPVRFCAVGDMGSGDEKQVAVAQRLSALAPALVLCLGDIVYPHGADEGYDERFFAPYRSLLPHTPFYPVLGNHDLHTADGAAYLGVFHLPQGPGQERFYSFDRGEVHFIGLDSNRDLGAGGAQARWLEADLTATSKPIKVAYFHHPPYTNGPHGEDEEQGRAMRENFVPILARHGVQLVLAGHDHGYERLTPRDGIQFFVSGSGGAPLRTITPGPDTLHSDDVHHQATCFASDGSGGLTFEAVAADGKVLDSGRLLLAGRPVPPPAVLEAARGPGDGSTGSTGTGPARPGCGCAGGGGGSLAVPGLLGVLALLTFRRRRPGATWP